MMKTNSSKRKKKSSRRFSATLASGIASAGLVAVLAGQVGTFEKNVTTSETGKGHPMQRSNSSSHLINESDPALKRQAPSSKVNHKHSAQTYSGEHDKEDSKHCGLPVLQVTTPIEMMPKTRKFIPIENSEVRMSLESISPRHSLDESEEDTDFLFDEEFPSDDSEDLQVNSIQQRVANYRSSSTKQTSSTMSFRSQPQPMKQKCHLPDDFEKFCQISHKGGSDMTTSGFSSSTVTQPRESFRMSRSRNKRRGIPDMQAVFSAPHSRSPSPCPSPNPHLRPDSTCPQCKIAQSDVNKLEIPKPSLVLTNSYDNHICDCFPSSRNDFRSRSFKEPPNRSDSRKRTLYHQSTSSMGMHSPLPERVNAHVCSPAKQFATTSKVAVPKSQEIFRIRSLKKSNKGVIVNDIQSPQDSTQNTTEKLSSSLPSGETSPWKNQKGRSPRLSPNPQSRLHHMSQDGGMQSTTLPVMMSIQTNLLAGSSLFPYPSAIYGVYLLGARQVGKSSLCEQLTSSEALVGKEEDSLSEDNNHRLITVQYEGEEWNLKLVDSGWQPNELTNTISGICYEEIDVLLVVYAIDDMSSFQYAKFLLNHIFHKLKRSSVMVLVGNKCDLVRSREVSNEAGKRLAQAYGSTFLEISTALNHQVNELLVAVVGSIKCSLGRNLNMAAATSGTQFVFDVSVIDSMEPGSTSRIKETSGRIFRFLKRQFIAKSCEELQNSEEYPASPTGFTISDKKKTLICNDKKPLNNRHARSFYKSNKKKYSTGKWNNPSFD